MIPVRFCDTDPLGLGMRYHVGKMPGSRRTIITVDASSFPYSPGDLVEQAEKLGLWGNCRVDAPFRAKIESIIFDADLHALRVVVTEAP